MFRAHEPAGGNHDRLVAVKVFRLDLTPEQASALVAELEALVAAGLKHPNIAAPIAAGLEHGTPYLAQEYAIGESLDVVLRARGPMPLSAVASLAGSLASAIDYAAEHSVHHGSLHLRDIFVEGDSLRITGFGIAAALTRIGAKRPTRPQYSSPDGASDVFSLGTIVFEAATGKRVSPDNLASFAQQHGVELRSAFDVALAANPDLRPDRASDFAAVLRDAVEMTEEAERNTRQALGAGSAEPEGNFKVAPIATAAPVAPDEPVPPPEHEDRTIVDDFDLHLDPTPAQTMEPDDDPRDELDDFGGRAHLPSAPAADFQGEPERRQWPLAAVLLVFAVLGGLSLMFFLRSSGTAAPDEAGNPVAETTVEIPAAAPPSPTPPAAAPAAPKPASAPAPPPRAAAARAPSRPMPAPAPSRPASGVVRPAQTGSLLVRSTPADADVVVNGQSRGKTPLALRELALGSYTIRVARNGYAAEERTLRLTTQRPSQSTTIELRSPAAPATRSGPGGLNVQSRPAGARVFVNNRLAGSTPVAIPGVPAGSATVRIEMDGYQPWTTTVRVNAGDQTRVAASLERQ